MQPSQPLFDLPLFEDRMATVRLARRAFIKCVYPCRGACAQDAPAPAVAVPAEREATDALMDGAVDMNDLRAYVDAVP